MITNHVILKGWVPNVFENDTIHHFVVFLFQEEQQDVKCILTVFSGKILSNKKEWQRDCD